MKSARHTIKQRKTIKYLNRIKKAAGADGATLLCDGDDTSVGILEGDDFLIVVRGGECFLLTPRDAIPFYYYHYAALRQKL